MKIFRIESVRTNSNLFDRVLCFDREIGKLSFAQISPTDINNNATDIQLRDIILPFFSVGESDKIILGKRVEGAYSAPINLYVDITDKCQLSCKHCHYSKLNKGNELDLSIINDIANECRELGIFFVKIAGGEPLLHSYFIDVVERFIHAGCYVSLSTNGIAITQELASFFYKNNVKVSVSMEGPKEIDEYIRGKGHYNEVIRSLEILKSNGVNVLLRFTLSKYLLDIKTIEKCIKIGIDNSVKVKFSRCRPLGKAIDSDISINEDYRRKYAEAIEFLNSDDFSETVLLDDGMKKIQDTNISGVLYNQRKCAAANSSMYINAAGNISPCRFLRDPFEERIKYKFGDINLYWSEISDSSFQKIRNVPMPDLCKKCSRLCKFKCLSSRLYATGSFSGNDPYCLYEICN